MSFSLGQLPAERNIKKDFKLKEITIYNTLKGRLETLNFEFTPENTTWFDGVEDIRNLQNCGCIWRAFDPRKRT